MGVSEILNTIMSLKNTKACGFDDICTEILKESRSELALILVYLINLSFKTGVFPDILKFSIVKPLHKKGNKSDLGNYRPITLISVLSKLFEKCMYSRLIDFCSKFTIIKKEQNGFQKGKSTTLACFHLVHNVLRNLDAKNSYHCTFF